MNRKKARKELSKGKTKMEDFKLKVVLSILGGIVFSFIFILLAFVLPANDEKKQVIIKPKTKLEKISHSLKQ